MKSQARERDRQVRDAGRDVRVESPFAAASSFFSWTGRLLLLAVLICAPWAFGGAEYEHQRWLYAGVLAALGLWLVAFSLQPGELRFSPPVVPTLLVPIVAALLLGGIQILPGPRSQLPTLNSVG